jgi:hypothetical protein
LLKFVKVLRNELAAYERTERQNMQRQVDRI